VSVRGLVRRRRAQGKDRASGSSGAARAAVLVWLACAVFLAIVLVVLARRGDDAAETVRGTESSPRVALSDEAKEAPDRISDAAATALVPFPQDPTSLSPEARFAGAAPWTLTVRVINAAGTVVTGAAVSLWAPGPVLAENTGDIDRGCVSQATTDESGRCAVVITSMQQQLLAEAESWGGSGVWTVDEALAIRDDRGDVPLQLLPRTVITGTVEHADGRPAVRCMLRCGLVEVTREHAGRPCDRPSSEVYVRDGHFRVLLDTGAVYTLSAVDDGDVTPEVRVAVERTGSTPEQVALRFEDRIAVRGTVLDPDGRPAGDAQVSWWFPEPEDPSAPSGDEPRPRERTSARYRLSVRSAADGGFAIATGREGVCTLIASGAGCAPGAPLVVEITGHPTEPVTLHLTAPATIRGGVSSANGSPLAGLSVAATPAAWRYEADASGGEDIETLLGTAECISDASGAFELTGLSAVGSYRVSCDLILPPQPDEAPVAFLERKADEDERPHVLVEPDVPAGTQDLQLVASEERLAGVEIRGRVVDALTGAPASSFGLRADSRFDLDSYRMGDDAVHLPDGRFLLRGAMRGERYTLTASGKLGDVSLAWATTDWFTAGETAEEIVIALGRMSDLVVVVCGANGAPIERAMVSVAWQEGTSHWATLFSSPEGRALFKPVHPGHYRIEVTHADTTVEDLVEVASGERRTVTLTLVPER